MPRYLYLLLLALFLCSATNLPAQRGKKSSASSQARTQADSLVMVQTLDEVHARIQNYDFATAAKLLQTAITRDKRRKRLTHPYEELLTTVQRAQHMLQGTEQITLVDSFVVPRAHVLSTIRLSRTAGRLLSLQALLPHTPQTAAYQYSTAYVNEFGDRAYFAQPDTAGYKTLFSAELVAGQWTPPAPIEGLSQPQSQQDFPFMMADGITLYYAAQYAEGLGGYDIYVTRFNSGTGRYVLPENIGMPFNSPANDYLYAIDEANDLGWFVTDRYQPADSVCVYVFVPNAQRILVSDATSDTSLIVQAASLQSIRTLPHDPSVLQAAQLRLRHLLQGSEQAMAQHRDFDFVLNDKITYHTLADFRQPAARPVAQRYVAISQEITQIHSYLSKLRQQTATLSTATRQEIITLEQTLLQRYREKDALTKQLRAIEQP